MINAGTKPALDGGELVELVGDLLTRRDGEPGTSPSLMKVDRILVRTEIGGIVVP
jgi:hypothetical protein